MSLFISGGYEVLDCVEIVLFLGRAEKILTLEITVKEVELFMSSKIVWLRANQIPQQIIRGRALEFWLCWSVRQFWSASKMCVPFQFSIVLGSERFISLHTDFVNDQCRKICKLVSPSDLYRAHILGPMKDCFWIFAWVGALFVRRSHMNKKQLGGLFNFKRDFPHHRGGIQISNLELG